jgi:hypothetical protein
VAQLKPSQRLALDSLARADAPDLTRARYEELTGVSRSQAAYDLAELVEAGLLVRVGGGRATRYRLAQAGDSGRRRWTDERIRTELTSFCADRTTWPSAGEFKAAGRSDLYVAASRYGGIRLWAAELGFPRAERRHTTRPLFPRRAVLAVAAVLAFALGAGVAALALRAQRHPVAAPAAPKAQSRAAPVSYLADLRALRRARVAGFAAQRAAASSRAAVVLRASRGDSWISVRTGAGRLLEERLLAAGSRVRLHGTALRIRLGAAGNVDLATNGSRLHALPASAAVVVVTRRGMRVAEWAPPPAAAPVLVASRNPTPAPPPPPPAAPAPLPKPVKPTPPPAPAAQAPKRSQAGWPTPLPSP